MREKYQLPPITPNPLEIRAAVYTLEQSLPRAKNLYQSGNSLAAKPPTRGALDALLMLDRMGSTADYRVAGMARNMAEEQFVKDTFTESLFDADSTNRSERVIELVRLGIVLELDLPNIPAPERKPGIFGRFLPSRPVLTPAEIASRTQEAEQAATRFEELHQKHTALIATAAAAAAAPPPPRSTPTSTVEPTPTSEPATPEPAKPTKWEVDSPDGKSPEWVAAQSEAAEKWEAVVLAKSLNLRDRKGPATNSRYDAALTIIRERVLDPDKAALTTTQIQAMIEYLTPKIWTQPSIPAKWFRDQFEGGKGTPLDLGGVKPAMKITLLPENLRSAPVPFSEADISDYGKFFRALVRGVHPNARTLCNDINPQYDEAVTIISKAVTESNRVIRGVIDPSKP